MFRILSLLLIAVVSLTAHAQDTYLEMKTTSGKQEVMTMKIYVKDGNSRVEISSNIEGAGINVAMLTLKKNPDMVYMLESNSKTYTEMDMKSLAKLSESNNTDYEVTVLGNEKIQGYNCVHTRVKAKDAKGSSYELWSTKEVPAYKELTMMQGQSNGDAKLQKLLEAKGADGFPVKVYAKENDNEVTMELTKVEKKTLASNLFLLDGYKKSEGFGGTGINLDEMQKAYEKLSPEERETIQKMLEQQDKTQPK